MTACCHRKTESTLSGCRRRQAGEHCSLYFKQKTLLPQNPKSEDVIQQGFGLGSKVFKHQT